MRSIQARLTGSLFISLIIVLLLQWVLVGASIRYLSEAYVATRLEHDAKAIVTALQFNKQPVAIAQDRIDPIYKRPYSGHYFKLLINGRQIRSRSLWDTELQMLNAPPGQSKRSHGQGPQNQQLLIWHSSYKKNQRLIKLSVAEDLTPIIKDINMLQLRHGLVSLGVLIILVLIQRVIVNRNLEPLELIRRELDRLDQGVIGQLSEDVPKEILPLVEELNYRLIALRKRLQRSRSASGNLAHALKTPLTLIFQIAESEDMGKYPQLKMQLKRQADFIQQSIERELTRARVAGEHVVGRRTPLLKEISDLVGTLSALYRAKSVAVEIEVDPQMTYTIDRQDMMELLGNILDNSYKWTNSHVRISAQQNQYIHIVVEDDGPGADLKNMDKLVQRGVRADEQVTGHGLGLSIVSEIIKDYNGEIEFYSSPQLGGLAVSMRIPSLKPKIIS